MASNANEVKIVTILRGIAALLVFGFHLVCVTNGYIGNRFLNEIFSYGKYGVHLFFVISGYVITLSMINSGYLIKDFPKFLIKRIIRIEPPYLFVLCMVLVYQLIKVRFGIGSGGHVYPEIKQVLYHIGYLIPFTHYDWLNIVFWTLAIEFQFYLIFSFLVIIFKNYFAGRLLLTSIFLGIYFIFHYDSMFFYWSPVFLIGIYLALFKSKKINKPELFIVVAVLSACIFYRLGYEVLLFALAGFAILFYEPRWNNRILLFFGNISYSLYLCHTLITFAIINMGFRFSLILPIKVIFITASILFTTLTSFLLYKYIELPSKRKASSIRYHA